jgi:hypothetical protein
MPETFGLFVAIEIVPTEALKTGLEGALHVCQPFALDETRQDSQAILFELFENARTGGFYELSCHA